MTTMATQIRGRGAGVADYLRFYMSSFAGSILNPKWISQSQAQGLGQLIAVVLRLRRDSTEAIPPRSRRSRALRGSLRPRTLGSAESLIGAVAGGSLGQRFGLLSGLRVLAARYAVLMVWQGLGVLTENDQPVALAEGESE